MNRSLLCLVAFALCACNPLPKTPEEEEKAAEAAQEKAAAAAKPKATPRKGGSWIYDNEKDRLGIQDKDRKGNYVNRLTGATPKTTPKKDDKYSNPLDKKAR